MASRQRDGTLERGEQHDDKHQICPSQPGAWPKYVYDFAEGSREMRDLLGGKGANICEMTRLLGADVVPGGFVITSEACVIHMSTREEPPASPGS